MRSPSLGEALRNRRVTIGQTLKEAATQIGVCNYSTLSLIERDIYPVVYDEWYKAFDHYINPPKIPLFKEPKLLERICVPDGKGHKKLIGYLVADYVDNDHVGIGISMCHPTDIFNKVVGKKLAISRIGSRIPIRIKAHTGIDHLEAFINYFIQRCLSYFKDKHILLPKIILT